MTKIIINIFILTIFMISFNAQATGNQNGKPNILIIGTGGTISGAGGNGTDSSYLSGAVGISNLVVGLPELKEIANIHSEQVFRVGSQDITIDHWLKLAKHINERLTLKDVDGIVVTHGTDTMEETAYFLNLTIKSKKPVILVGAMRPSTALGSDGASNLYSAVALACSKEAVGKGVLVVMNNEINASREITKTNTTLLHSFRAPEGVLGYVQNNLIRFYRFPTHKHTYDTEFDISKVNELPQVDIVYGYADNNGVALNAFVKEGGANGIVYAGVGNGNLSNGIKSDLIMARKKGIIIVRASRVGQGIVIRNAETNDDELDFIVSDNMNPQKARILLMLALTKTNDTKKIQQMFYTY